MHFFHFHLYLTYSFLILNSFDTVADFYSEKMEKDFKNLKNKENVLKYKKIYQENLELGKNKLDKDENERNAKRNMVKVEL